MTAAASLEERKQANSWGTTIGNLCDQFGGEVQTGPFGSQLHASDYSEEGVPVVMPQDMTEGRIVCDRIARVGAQHVEKLQRHMLLPGDIVYSRRGDVTRFAVVTDIEKGWLCGTGSIRIRLNSPDIDIGYARRYLQQEEVGEWLMRNAQGVTMPNLNTKVIRALPFVYPPLAEQKRIAAILDAADALRAKRRESLAQLDTLLQSTFLDMFGDPVTNPKGWDVVKSIDAFSTPPRIGTTTPASGKGFLVVRVGEIGTSRIAFQRCGRVQISDKDFAKFQLETGDTVIARAIGSKEQLGKASYFSGHDEDVVVDSHVMRLRPDPTKCDGVWFYSLISSHRGKVLLQHAGGATAVQFNINAKQASGLLIPLPPLALQRRFATIVESVEHQKSLQRAHLAELDTLFASLQSRAFRGEL